MPFTKNFDEFLDLTAILIRNLSDMLNVKNFYKHRNRVLMLVSFDYVNLVLVNIQKSEPMKKLITFSDLIAHCSLVLSHSLWGP